jgi:hypothetical protein
MAAGAARPVGPLAGRAVGQSPPFSKLLIRRRLTDETAARPQRCFVPRKLAESHTAIREQVKARPDATLEEPRAWPLRTHSKTLAQVRLT